MAVCAPVGQTLSTARRRLCSTRLRLGLDRRRGFVLRTEHADISAHFALGRSMSALNSSALVRCARSFVFNPLTPAQRTSTTAFRARGWVIALSLHGTAAHANRLHQPRRRATASAWAAAGRLKLPERQHGQSLLSAGAASTPLPPEAGSGRHATPGGATMALSALWEARARAPASAKVSDSTAFHHPGKATLRHCHDGLRRSWSSHLTGRLRHRP